MDNDFLLVLGVFIGLLSVPSMISALSDGRPPRAAIMLFVIGAGLVAWIVTSAPNTYTIEAFPKLVLDVIGGLVR